MEVITTHVGDELNIMSPSSLKRSHTNDFIDEPLRKRARANSEHSDSSCGSRISYLDDRASYLISTPHTPLTPSSPGALQPSRRKTRLCPYPDCGKAFNRPARLEEHIRSHTNSRPFKCPHPPCEKDFLRQSHLTHHVKSAHTSIRDYACDWEDCTKRFLTATRLRRHQQAHEGREQFRCTGFPPCAENFRKHATLQKHIDKEHLHRRPFPCDELDVDTGLQCDCGYDTLTKLQAHKRKQHGQHAVGGRYWCSLCTFETQTVENDNANGFSSHSELQSHITLVHPQQCDDCALICTSASDLQRHIEIHHSGMTLDERRTFPCIVPGCDKAFTKKGNLNVHTRTVHAELRPFICGTTDLRHSRDLETWTGKGACGQNFGAKSTLEAHVRSQHLGIPYSTRLQKRTDPQAERSQTSTEISTVAKLTGAGYAEESGREITCFDAPRCQHRFMRDYDLRVHAIAKHGMSDLDVAEAFREREALTGGAFWIGGFDGFDLQGYAAADGGGEAVETGVWLGGGGNSGAPEQNWDFDFDFSLTGVGGAHRETDYGVAAPVQDAYLDVGVGSALQPAVSGGMNDDENNDGHDFMDELIDPALVGF